MSRITAVVPDQNMQIYYCDTCGVRVSDDQIANNDAVSSDGVAYCSKCRPAQVKRPSNAGHPRVERAIVQHPTAAHARPKTVAQRPEKTEQGLGKGIVVGAGVTAIALCGLFYVLMQKPNDGAKANASVKPSAVTSSETAKKIETTKNDPSAKPSVQPSTPLPANTGTPREDEARARQARERWFELKMQADRLPEVPTSLRKEIKAFSETYASLDTGKEAAEYYKNIDKRPVPAAQPAQTPVVPAAQPAVKPVVAPQPVVQAPPAPPAGADKTIADFKRDFKAEKFPTGWRYLWNPDAPIGQTSKYVAMVWNAQTGYAADAVKFPGDGAAGCVTLNAGTGHPGKGAKQETSDDRYAIAAYTLQAGQGGKIGIAVKLARTDTQHAGRLDVRVLVNDTEKKHAGTDALNTSQEFSADLGVLKEGDTVYVAVGPEGEDFSDGFTLDFSIYSIP